VDSEAPDHEAHGSNVLTTSRPPEKGIRGELKLRVLGFGSDKDGDIGIGFFPGRKEIL